MRIFTENKGTLIGRRFRPFNDFIDVGVHRTDNIGDTMIAGEIVFALSPYLTDGPFVVQGPGGIVAPNPTGQGVMILTVTTFVPQ